MGPAVGFVRRQAGSLLITGGTGMAGSAVAAIWSTITGWRTWCWSAAAACRPTAWRSWWRNCRTAGAQVSVVACDVADREAVAGLLAHVPARYPLRAVFTPRVSSMTG